MLARGIRSYHRPTRLEEALDLVARGVVPVAGGTRLLAGPAEIPNLLDLSGLGLNGLAVDDGDLVIGTMATLQDILDSRLAHDATAGLLPAACRLQSPSPLLRGMATAGGESVHGAHDSEVVAALLALNAVYTVVQAEETLEIPAVRFIRRPHDDLRGGGLVQSILIPGTPHGTAIERVAPLPSAPAVVAAIVTVSFSGESCGRARIVFTGLTGPPSRVPEAEAKVEGTPAEADNLEACIEQAVSHAAFRDDARASAAYRRRVAGPLLRRALNRAIAAADAGSPPEPPRRRVVPGRRAAPAVPYFTSGRIELTVNGQARRFTSDARTTLLELLRREGFWGVKRGCETGDCGSCAVLLDGRPVASCLTLALRAHGHGIQTVESLGSRDHLHPVQEAFVESGAIQCGFCTPAMELCARALLDAVPDPTDAEVRDALGGCLCSCTGYAKAIEAVQRAAGKA